jgi:hypothetical protein
MVLTDEPRHDFVFDDVPQTDDELWWAVRYLFGVEIPRTAVCEGHSAPFDTFADAFFARHDNIVVKASRALAGKTYLMATLIAAEAVLLDAPVTLLGGSLEQSGYAHEYSKDFWEFHDGLTSHLLKSDPTHRKTTLTAGGEINVLTASTKSARGSHRPRLRLDEVDEMDLKVLTAALGTPMEQRALTPQVLMGSTWHNPKGTFTYVLEDLAVEHGWPVREWCYRECRRDDPNVVGGWLSDAEIERHKGRVPNSMWIIEYELGEPSIEGRAIVTEKVEAAFDEALGIFEGAPNEYIEIEAPVEGARYAHGVDWAKDVDWTVIATFRTDVSPWLCVAWERTGRLEWPLMVRKLEDRLARYRPTVDGRRRPRVLTVAHDATGLGDVIDDYVDVVIEQARPDGIKLVGDRRRGIFSDYIAAIEDDAVRYPRIKFAFDEHRYATMDELYGSGHPPDTFVAGALGWTTRFAKPPPPAAPRGPRAPSKFRRP